MREMKRMIEREMDDWLNVQYSFDIGGRHNRVIINVGDQQRFYPFTTTKTDRRGMLNNITQIRRALCSLGASRK